MGGLSIIPTPAQIGAVPITRNCVAGSNVTVNGGASAPLSADFTIAATGGGGGISGVAAQTNGSTIVAAATTFNFGDAVVTDGGASIAIIDEVPFYSGCQFGLAIVPNGAAPTGIGNSVTTLGLVAKALASTNAFTLRKRVGLSIASANSASYIYKGTAQSDLRAAGFKYFARFGVETFNSDSRILMGYWGGGFTATNDPSNATDAFFIGADSADTNLQIMHNDSAGTCTKVTLGANFPAKTALTDIYSVVLIASPSGATMTYFVKNETSGNTASGTISTNLPTAATLVWCGCWYETGATAVSQTMSLFGFFTKNQLPY